MLSLPFFVTYAIRAFAYSGDTLYGSANLKEYLYEDPTLQPYNASSLATYIRPSHKVCELFIEGRAYAVKEISPCGMEVLLDKKIPPSGVPTDLYHHGTLIQSMSDHPIHPQVALKPDTMSLKRRQSRETNPSTPSSSAVSLSLSASSTQRPPVAPAPKRIRSLGEVLSEVTPTQSNITHSTSSNQQTKKRKQVFGSFSKASSLGAMQQPISSTQPLPLKKRPTSAGAAKKWDGLVATPRRFTPTQTLALAEPSLHLNGLPTAVACHPTSPLVFVGQSNGRCSIIWTSPS